MPEEKVLAFLESPHLWIHSARSILLLILPCLQLQPPIIINGCYYTGLFEHEEDLLLICQ